MRCHITLFTALAVTVELVRATPVQVHARTPSTFTDPFVNCVRKTYPQFPKEGNPTTEESRACLGYDHLKKPRELAVPDPTNNAAAKQPTDVHTDSTQAVPRGLFDFVTDVLDKKMAVDQKAQCIESDSTPSKLHDEFPWIEDVTGLAEKMCKNVTQYIDQYGIAKDGGVASTVNYLTNAHDWQSNTLKNGRNIMVTTTLNFFPPAKMAINEIKDLAGGLHTLCTAGIQRIMTPETGCTEEVSWWVSQKAHYERHRAALGGQVGMFFDGSKNPVAALQLGFSQDSN